MSTFHMDGYDIQILDMRSPGQPVIELKGHHAQINALGWGSIENSLLATAGKYPAKFNGLSSTLYMQGMIVSFCYGI